jgi:nucleoside-diphosphate-sugar epimerase
MKVLMTGHNGYIGAVMTDFLHAAGHLVHGLDTFFFEHDTLGEDSRPVTATRKDIRDVRAADLVGVDAVIHLAALSNDPLGSLDADVTYAINHGASVRLAQRAKEAGVPRYLFASSCSLYGVAGDAVLSEDAPFNPITPYGVSKVRVEEDVSRLADDRFTPTFLRNATAYGTSPRFRGDIVVNNLVAAAHTTGRVRILSDGSPWRPLVHVEDICRAFLAVLEAPRELVHNEAFNIGLSSENYRVSDLGEMVEALVPGSQLEYAPGGLPDPRCYRVDCSKLRDTLPEFQPRWTVQRGIEDLVRAFGAWGLSRAEFEGGRFTRIAQILKLRKAGRLDAFLRWCGSPAGLEPAGTSAGVPE